MARKDIFAAVLNTSDNAATVARPVLPSFTSHGAAGALTRSIDSLAARADTAEQLEAQLKAGHAIVELDPAIVDPSFVSDRMAQDDESYQTLRAAIEAQGQHTPILVRSHPQKSGRYQVAFGHRRLRVAIDLKRPVRAVVRELSDQELVLAQGQENSARADLSYIERARFAQRLEQLGYDRSVIMSALTVDKAAVSRMLSVMSRIPGAVVDAIGPAHGIGRRRWVELVELIECRKEPFSFERILESKEFGSAESDQRFDLVASFVAAGGANGKSSDDEEGQGSRASSRDAQHWAPKNGKRCISMTHSARSSVIAIDRRHAPGFGEFILGQMDRLYGEYLATKPRASSEPSAVRRRR